MKRNFIILISILLAATLCSCTSYPDTGSVMGTLPGNDATEPTYTLPTETEGTLPPAAPTSDYSGAGIFESDTGTTLVLRMEWEARQDPEAHRILLDLRLFLEYEGELNLTPSTANTLTVGDEQITFETEAEYPESEEPVLICEHSFTCDREDGEDIVIRAVGKVYSGCTFEEYEFKSLTVQGNIIVSDKYKDMADKAELTVDVIDQLPELPNGCEVTSLAMVLNYHGYEIGKMELKEGYLPIGSENIYEYNIGDPAERKGSYGCYSPVIKRTADAYYKDNGIERSATDLTHCNIEELYYQVSQGEPVIVWATQYMETRPYNIKSWEIDGITFNWKAPLHCMVLSGYDMEEGTVTLTDPLYGVVTHEMALFEERWHQMGEQAVIA